MRGRKWMMWLLLGMLMGCAKQRAPDAAQSSASAPAASADMRKAEEPRCTDEPRTDERDERPRCGGSASAQPYAYRITLDNGESFTACDIANPFFGSIGGGLVTMSFVPVDGRGGTMSWLFDNGKGVIDIGYDYVLQGTPETMTGTFHANSEACGKVKGRTACAKAATQTFTSTWSRMGRCQPANARPQ